MGKRITNLVPGGALVADALFETTDDPSGSPVSTKHTVTQMQTFVLDEVVEGIKLADGSKGISIGSQPPTAEIGVNYTATVAGAGGIEQFGFVCDTTFGYGADAISAFHGRVNVPDVAATFDVVRGLGIEDAGKGASATISAQYGIYIAPQTKGVVNYAIWTETGPSHFGDDIDIGAGKSLKMATVKVLGAQGAAVADATDAASAITQLNALLARLRAHGLIAT